MRGAMYESIAKFSRPFSLVEWEDNYNKYGPRLKWSLSCQLGNKRIVIEGKLHFKKNISKWQSIPTFFIDILMATWK